jgi:ABC-2 type transporter
MTATTHAALTHRARPAPPGPLSASLTFGWRALLKIKHVPEQLFDVTMFPIMFTLLFTFLFGNALAGSTSAYAEFAIPGVLVQTVAFLTVYTGIALNADIAKGIFDRFRSLPIWRQSVLTGALFADLARYTFAAMVVFVLGVALGFPARQRVRRAHRICPHAGVRAQPHHDLDDPRDDATHARGRHAGEHVGPVPCRVPDQHLGIRDHHAGLAPGHRQGQPGDEGGDRRT